MWTVLILLSLGSLHCTGSSSLPIPTNVLLSSVNLRNLLHWLPGNGTSDKTHFTVQYAIYGDSVVDSKRRLRWRPVRGCTEIMRSWCDLSNETWDLEQLYYARVRAVHRGASSKWVLTQRFDPMLDTTIGPPMVSVEIEDNSAIITLKGPMRYQPNNHTPAVSMSTLYPQMMYNLSINNTRRSQTNHVPVVSSPYIFHLEYDTEYCFSATTKFLSMPVKCQSSAWHCITTLPDPLPRQLQTMVVGIVVSSVCLGLLGVASYLLYHYLSGKGQKTPKILDQPIFSPPPPLLPSENPSLFLIAVIKPPDIKNGMSEPSCPMQQQQVADPPPYVPQGSETLPESEESWDDVSIDYGFVSVASNINDRGEEEERQRMDGGDDGNNLRRQDQNDLSRDSCEKNNCRVKDGLSAGVDTAEEKPYLSQISTQTHTPICTQTELSTLLQARPFSQATSTPLTPTQSPFLSFQGDTKVESDGEKRNGEFSGLFIDTISQNGLFPVPLNPQTTKEGGMGEEMDGEVRVRTDGNKDEGVKVESESENETASLLSAYVSHNMSTSPTDQSDFLLYDHGVLGLAAAGRIEEDDDEDEEEEGTLCIDWDPKTRKLVLPEISMAFTKQAWLDSSVQGEKRDEKRLGREKEGEEVGVTKGKLTLDNVFVRQPSEEEEETQGEMETDDLLTKWDLVISMDQ